ncbi:MAG: SprT family zinc-dependent metalloprotease [Pseudomonadota bacterium]
MSGRQRARQADSVILDDPPVRVALRYHARARRFTLRLSPEGDGAVLTLPEGVAPAHAAAFLREHRGWLARALAEQPTVPRLVPGTVVPIDGIDRVLVAGTHRGAPRLETDRIVLPAGRQPGPALSALLKKRARDRLVPAVHRYAAVIGKEPAAVSLRDTRSRWGSCSSARRIGFSWRLAMAPVTVQDYVAAHEAAHLQHMDHSPRYWATLRSIMPDYQIHRSWLRREGRKLHAFRFNGDD